MCLRAKDNIPLSRSTLALEELSNNLSGFEERTEGPQCSLRPGEAALREEDSRPIKENPPNCGSS